MKKGLWYFKFLLLGFLSWFIYTRLNFSLVWHQAQSISVNILLPVILLMLLLVLLGVIRWQVIMNALGHSLSFFKTFQLFYIGLFFNTCLPGGIGGEMLRMWEAHRQGLPFKKAVGSVALERIFGLLSLVLLVMGTTPLLFKRIGASPLIYGTLLLAVFCLFGIGLFILLKYLPTMLQKIRVFRAFAYIANELIILLLSKKNAVKVLGISFLSHFVQSLVVYLLAGGLHLSVTIVDCLVIVPPVILTMSLPISIAGWGVREGAMVVAFGFLGVQAEDAFTLSVLFGLLFTLISFPGGLIWLFTHRHIPRAEIEDMLV